MMNLFSSIVLSMVAYSSRVGSAPSQRHTHVMVTSPLTAVGGLHQLLYEASGTYSMHVHIVKGVARDSVKASQAV